MGWFSLERAKDTRDFICSEVVYNKAIINRHVKTYRVTGAIELLHTENTIEINKEYLYNKDQVHRLLDELEKNTWDKDTINKLRQCLLVL